MDIAYVGLLLEWECAGRCVGAYVVLCSRRGVDCHFPGASFEEEAQAQSCGRATAEGSWVRLMCAYLINSNRQEARQ